MAEFTFQEKSTILNNTAAVRHLERGADVVLVGDEQKTLCHCESESDANLIKKLFNRGMGL